VDDALDSARHSHAHRRYGNKGCSLTGSDTNDHVGLFKRTPPPAETIQAINKPVLFIAGTHDPTVPSKHSRSLYKSASKCSINLISVIKYDSLTTVLFLEHPKYLWEIHSDAHLQGFDLYGAKEFHQKFDEFVDRHLPCGAR
jgi:fermentation-respiration switch protein FrsA (DUF1100 family)